MALNPDQFAAEIYDQTVTDWPGEMDFYRAAAKGATSVLEVACGTGRIGLRLAKEGWNVTGFDLSPHMIEIARHKAEGIHNIDLFVADMTRFDLGRTFDLVIIPGHSFQFMLTIEAQLACLASIRRHLSDVGETIVHIDHQDPAWLGGLPIKPEGAFGDASELSLPEGGALRTMKRWSYDRATQTAALVTKIEQTDASGVMVDTATRGPVRMHCFFRYEMELLLEKASFELQALYGDFSRGSLTHDSTEMIWVTSRPLRSAIRDRRAPAGI
jgi:SAM-dependent methyltransferase